ncbi:hypothetical protein HID58_074586 [Brassica napus]|uniref:Uncharacterized protein n=1 Tax=Brassica napus TaxID=3708 RepID=A0ABQ7YH90_BRANA|nr:hypothetical protein HID58_074586 [Brassica napus]
MVDGILILYSTPAPAAASIGWNLSILIILSSLCWRNIYEIKMTIKISSFSDTTKLLSQNFCCVFCCGDANDKDFSSLAFERLSLSSMVFWSTPGTFRQSSTKAFTMSSMVFWSINGLFRSNSQSDQIFWKYSPEYSQWSSELLCSPNLCYLPPRKNPFPLQQLHPQTYYLHSVS